MPITPDEKQARIDLAEQVEKCIVDYALTTQELADESGQDRHALWHARKEPTTRTSRFWTELLESCEVCNNRVYGVEE